MSNVRLIGLDVHKERFMMTGSLSRILFGKQKRAAAVAAHFSVSLNCVRPLNGFRKHEGT